MDDPPLVRCFNGTFSAETGAAHLLFEDVSRTHYQTERPLPPPRPQCDSTLDGFAAFHAFWWDHPGLGSVADLPTAESTAAYRDAIARHYRTWADALGDALSARRRRIYEEVMAALPKLHDRLTRGAGLTLIHGDANFWNVLLPRDPEVDRALIIDWQLWGVSFGAEDLANLIALHWYGDRRRGMEQDLIKRYHRGLMQGSVSAYPWDDCWLDYRLAVITRALFMPMWIWSSGQRAAGWWPDLERAMQAFDDLECRDLLP
jgi:hypothetical protein